MEPDLQRAGVSRVRSDSRSELRAATSGNATETAAEKHHTASREETTVEESTASRVPATAVAEDASRFCPVCSRRLESRRCKLTCNVCGYYMSCADYY